jgi:hypothetical protein
MQRKNQAQATGCPTSPLSASQTQFAFLGRAQKGWASSNPDSTLGVISVQISAAEVLNVSDLLSQSSFIPYRLSGCVLPPHRGLDSQLKVFGTVSTEVGA